MNHAVVTEHLADYLEGDLALELRALVDAHLDTCSACALEVREMQQTIRILRALPEPEPPPMIAANVMRRIRAGETRPSLLERIVRVLGGVLEPSFVLPASAMAVAALVIFAIQEGGLPARVFDATDVQGAVGRGSPLAMSGTPQATLSSPDATERNFGASAVRELAATPPSSPRSAPEGAGSPSFEAPGNNLPSSDSAFASRDPMTAAPWDSRPARQQLSRRQGTAASFFGDPVLAQGFAAEVAGPGARPASSRGSGAVRELRVGDSGGEDPRDAWLARALENPVDFAQYIARHNLAEQELWVERLSERALSRGLLAELVDALRSTGNEKASWLADDFAAQTEADDSGAADGGAPRASEGSPGLGR